jgi:copper chaperone CopZ
LEKNMDAKCHVEPFQKIARVDELQDLTTLRLAVWGIGCPNCANRVRNSLLSLIGVVKADVDHTTGSALVKYSPDLVSVPFLLEAVSHAGNDGHHKYVAMLLEEAPL